MCNKIVLIAFWQLLVGFTILAQSSSQILIISNVNAKAILDGSYIGALVPNSPSKFEVSSGEHYLQVQLANGEEKNKIINLEEGKQKVIKFDFETSGSPLDDQRIKIADVDFNIPGLVTANAQEGFEYPYFLYAFEKGDRVMINLEMTNLKGTNVINVSTYPDGNIIYSNDSFQQLKDINFQVKERSIYVFSFASNHTFDRDARLVVERIPIDQSTSKFNTKVSWQESYSVQTIHKPQKFYINSGSHATLQGGKSRVVLPLKFPENTVKWFYTFSASRDESQIESVSGTLGLASELSSLIDRTGLLSFGIDQLTQPPGSDYCDIYLLDHQNSNLFTSKNQYSYFTEGTRENLKSGVVDVECCINDQLYLGIKNPDNFHGVHVAIEVAVVVKEESWVMHQID